MRITGVSLWIVLGSGIRDMTPADTISENTNIIDVKAFVHELSLGGAAVIFAVVSCSLRPTDGAAQSVWARVLSGSGVPGDGVRAVPPSGPSIESVESSATGNSPIIASEVETSEGVLQ